MPCLVNTAKGKPIFILRKHRNKEKSLYMYKYAIVYTIHSQFEL
jgi:hypothetical protein